MAVEQGVDIKKQSEETLTAAATGSLGAAAEALFQAAPVPAYVYELESLRFLEVNATAVARYGWSREEFLEMTLLDIRPPEDEARLRREISRGVEGLAHAGIWRHCTKAGEQLEVEIHTHTLEFQGQRSKLAFVHDVSRRVRYERSLEDAADRYRALVQALPGVLFLVDEDGFYLEGAGERELLAKSVNEFVGKQLSDIFSPEQAREFLEVIHRALDAERPLDYSYEMDVPSGRRWFEARVSPLRTSVHGRRAVVWSAWDVTERMHATQALRESEARLRAILDSEPESVKVIDSSGRLESMNRAGLHMLGLSSLDEVGDVMRFVAPCDHEPFQNVVANALAGTPGKLAFDAIRNDGVALRLHTTVVPLRDAGGAIVSALAITRDITETRRLSRAFEEQAELLRSIFNFIPIMIGVFDGEGRLTFPNRALIETLGWSADQLKALVDPLSTILLSTAQQADAEAFFSGDARGASGWREYATRTADQRSLRVAWASVHLSDGRRILIGQDVTEQRNLEEQTWQSQKLESLGKLAGGVAHDFNNMLTVILGYVELLLMQPSSDEAARDDMKNIQQAAQRARDLTAQLLAFGRRQVTQRRLTAPEDVVHEIVPLMRRVLGEAIALDMRLAAKDVLVFADAAQLEQILMNLVLNARDAMPGGGRVTIETARVEPGAGTSLPQSMQGVPCVELVVSDTGHGMDAATLERVFEPFFSTKGLGAGTGLGLSTAYGAVQQNGGHIVATSPPGQGASFTIYFPVAEGELAAPRAAGAAIELTPGRGEIVLLVEDEATVREFLGRVLRQANYDVLEAGSVEEALRVAGGAESIDLVLTDVVMTDGSGLEVVRAVEALHPHARRLLASGYAESEAVREYLLDPSLNFLQKPITPEVLLRRVAELLRGA